MSNIEVTEWPVHERMYLVAEMCCEPVANGYEKSFYGSDSWQKFTKFVFQTAEFGTVAVRRRTVTESSPSMSKRVTQDVITLDIGDEYASEVFAILPRTGSVLRLLEDDELGHVASVEVEPDELHMLEAVCASAQAMKEGADMDRQDFQSRAVRMLPLDSLQNTPDAELDESNLGFDAYVHAYDPSELLDYELYRSERFFQDDETLKAETKLILSIEDCDEKYLLMLDIRAPYKLYLSNDEDGTLTRDVSYYQEYLELFEQALSYLEQHTK